MAVIFLRSSPTPRFFMYSSKLWISNRFHFPSVYLRLALACGIEQSSRETVAGVHIILLSSYLWLTYPSYLEQSDFHCLLITCSGYLIPKFMDSGFRLTKLLNHSREWLAHFPYFLPWFSHFDSLHCFLGCHSITQHLIRHSFKTLFFLSQCALEIILPLIPQNYN